MSKKRSREEGGVDVQLVEIYEDLSSDVESVRVTAAKSLLGRLNAEPVIREKVLQRLFRGLASGRKSARIGFSVVLTELLRTWQKGSVEEDLLTLTGIIDMLEANTKIGKDAKGQESRDHYLGKLFGAAAIVQSGVLFAGDRYAPLWGRLLKFILETGKQKVWLREECGWMLYQSVKTLRNYSIGEQFVKKLLDQLEANAQLKTPEGVAIWIAVQQEFPEFKLPKDIFRHQDPLNRKEKGTLARILKQSSALDQTNGDASQTDTHTSSGTWSSKPHFAWDVVFTTVLEPGKKQVTFSELWRDAVDESLFSLKSSPERKYWGFLLFQKYILSAPTSLIPCLFGSNLLGTLKFHLRSDEQTLHAMAVDVVDTIVARSLEDTGAVTELVFGFLNADINFDRFAKAKPLEKLIGRADLHSLERIVLRIISEIEQRVDPAKEEDLHGLTSLADSLVSVFRSHKFPEEKADLDQYRRIVNVVLGTFVQQAFAAKKTSQATQELFKQRLMFSLNHITANDAHPAHHPCTTITMIRRGVGKNVIDAESEVLEAIERGNKLLDKVQVKESTGRDSGRRKTLQAFELLLAFALLQAYSGEAESVNTIDDLQNCYQSLIKKRSDKGDEKEDAVALVEIIVEFVSKPSALYRRLAPKILSAFSSRVNEEGLDVMLKVLDTTENTSGQAELFANGEEAALDVEASLEADSEDSDVEMVDGAASEASDSDGSGSDSAAESDRTSEEDAELQAFDAQLAAALGTKVADADGAGGNDSASDSDMTDSAMEALDAQLSTIFKQRLGAGRNNTPKQQRRGARDTIINFKTKVLELLEVYVKEEHLAPAALHIIAPLLRSMHSTNSPQIAQRSYELIRQFMKLYKLRTVQQEEQDGQQEDTQQREAGFTLLKDVHTLMHETGSAMQAKACTSASLLATKVYLAHGGRLDEVNKVYDRTRKSLESDGEFKFRQCFMLDWQNWQTQARKTGQLEGR